MAKEYDWHHYCLDCLWEWNNIEIKKCPSCGSENYKEMNNG